MRSFQTCRTAVAAAACLAAGPSAAAEAVSIPELQATTRALGFVDTLPRDGTLAVGVVYGPNAQALANQTANQLNMMPGPNASVIRAVTIAASDLERHSGRLDALFVVPGTSAAVAGMDRIVQQKRVMSISNDPACLDMKTCVLMVRAGRSVEIVLDTAAAETAGVSISPIFAMMVKRR